MVISDPGPCPSGNCLKLPNVTIDPQTSVLPCGGTFSVDMGQYADFTAAEGTVVWSIISYDTTIYENMAISNAGVVTGSTTGGAAAAIAGDLQTPKIKIVIQAADSGSLLAVQRTLTLPIKNACLNKTCDPGFTCNPCTGNCIEGDIDLILT